ncbi:helix-turn-helix domain-containing protein [Paenibacillus koleovorans]|uniref:helix-turn-helix domain-containing protein n=1 Tax=Paenibacillus koleovorans TaxID=121608 RepID=UPI000FDB28F0|nr:helix-turn-helix domain-containing protein [Paenibacillus koleovorans]
MQSEMTVRSFIGTRDEDWKDQGFHQHATVEISLLMEGRGVFEWSAKRDSLEAGNVVIIPAELPHRFEGISRSRYGVIHIHYAPPRLRDILSELVEDRKPTMFTLSALDKDRYEKLFREWLRMVSVPLKEKAWTYSAWLEVLMLFLLEHSQSNREALSITRAGDWIRGNLQHGVQISELAALAGMTEAGFRRSFESVYRMSPKQYQQQCRMAEAKWQLSASSKDMAEIADCLGFSRPHSFSQWFKNIEGISPTEWRRQQMMQFG